ncbi:MAG: hypothetical protein AB7K73_07675 [Gammaproteobacteria bacterium]
MSGFDDLIAASGRKEEKPFSLDGFGDTRDPDQVAGDINLGRELGQPPSAIAAYRDMFSRAAQAQRARTRVQQTPRLREWLERHPDNFAVARDDIETLAQFEPSDIERIQRDLGRFESVLRWVGFADRVAVQQAVQQAGQQRGAQQEAPRGRPDALGQLFMDVFMPTLDWTYMQRRSAARWARWERWARDPLANEMDRLGRLDVERGVLSRRDHLARTGGGEPLTDAERARLEELENMPGQDDWGPFIIGPMRRLWPQIVGSFTNAANVGGANFAEMWDDPWAGRFENAPAHPWLPGLVQPRLRTRDGRSVARHIAEGLVGSVIQAPPALFAGGTGVVTGYFGFTYDQETGLFYREAVRQGIDPDIAAQLAEEHGRIATAVEVASDLTGLRLLAGPLVRKLLTRFLYDRGNWALRGAITLNEAAATQAGEEIAQEISQVIHQDLARHMSEGGDRNWGAVYQAWTQVFTPENLSRILSAGIIGYEGGVGMSAGPVGVNAAIESRAYVRGLRGAAQMEARIRAAQQSQLGNRSPETFEAAVGAMDDSSVYIDAAPFVEYYQERGLNAYEQAAALGVPEAALAEALASHGQIEIPTAVFFNRVARNTESAGLARFVRSSPDAFTPAEMENAAEVFNARIDAVVAESQKVADDRAMLQYVETRMLEIFEAAEKEGGPPRQIAREYARVVSALPQAMMTRARLAQARGEVSQDYVDRLEGQFRKHFGEGLEVQGPAREGVDGGVSYEHRGRGPNAGPVRNDTWAPPEGVRLSERQRKIAEMAINGASNEWIADEMSDGDNLVSPNAVRVTLSQVKQKLGGTAPWEAAVGGAEAGVNPRTGEITATNAKIAAAYDELVAAGYTNRTGIGNGEITSALAQRFGMSRNAVNLRLNRIRKARRAADAAAVADPPPQSAMELRRAWVEAHVVRRLEPGVAGDVRFGFVLSSGRRLYAEIIDDGNGAAQINWSFLDRLLEVSEDDYTALFGDGKERLTASDWRELRTAIQAIVEADVAAHERPAYVFTPQRVSNRRSNMKMVAELNGLGYDLYEDGETVYLFRPGAGIARNGRIKPHDGWAPNFEEPVDYGSQEEADDALRDFVDSVPTEVSTERPSIQDVAKATLRDRQEAARRRAEAEGLARQPEPSAGDGGGVKRRWTAALRDPDTGVIYTGASHAEALDYVPEDRFDAILNDASASGFLTDDGRFLSREEALAEIGATLSYEQDKGRGSILPRGWAPGQFGTAIIKLRQSANLATFLHEFGHLGHFILESAAGDPEAPLEFRQMWADTLAWWGVSQEQWDGLDAEGRRPYFERWARTFEAYLMEGKAPSLRLRDSFKVFARWLLEIYRTVFALDADLNPRIRAVFDRMLATDQEIAEARAAMGADFTLPRDAFKTDAEYEAALAANAEAAEALEAEVRARALDAYARRGRRAWRNAREALRAAATRKVDADRARRAADWLSAQEWRDLPDTALSEEGEISYVAAEDALEDMPEGLPPMRLDPEAIAQDEQWAKLPLPVRLRLGVARDADAILAEAMRAKRAGKDRQAQRLWAFIKAQGGINLSRLSEEQRARVMDALGSARKRPGLINNATGKSPEQIMGRAAAAGYFGEAAARLYMDETRARQAAAEIVAARQEKAPQSLTSWVRAQGGIADDRGDIAGHAGDNQRGFARLLRRGGRSIDDLALAAWEQGFFPDHAERPSINDFIDALNAESRGADPTRGRKTLHFWEAQGVDISLSQGELVDALHGRANPNDAAAVEYEHNARGANRLTQRSVPKPAQIARIEDIAEPSVRAWHEHVQRPGRRGATPAVATRIIELSYSTNRAGQYLNPTEIAAQMQREGFFKGKSVREAADVVDARRSLLRSGRADDPSRAAPAVKFPELAPREQIVTKRMRDYWEDRARMDEEAHRLFTEGDGSPVHRRGGARTGVRSVGAGWTLKMIADMQGRSITETSAGIARHKARLEDLAEEKEFETHLETMREFGVRQHVGFDARDIILMVNDGLTNAEIAAELGISADRAENIVGVHKSHAYRAVSAAIEAGAVDRLAAAMNVSADELRVFVENKGKRLAPSLKQEARRLIAAGVVNNKDIIARLRAYAEEKRLREPTEDSLTVIAASARSAAGLARPMAARLSEDKISEIVAMRRDGVGASEIAERLSLNRAVIASVIERARARGEPLPVLRRGRSSVATEGAEFYHDKDDAPAPIYVSAVERILEQSTTQRASGAQWWATISKAPGVKKEELQWIGLEDWLAAQDGQVSREDVLAFVRENGVTVEETVLGGDRASVEESPRHLEIQRERLALIEERERVSRAMDKYDDDAERVGEHAELEDRFLELSDQIDKLEAEQTRMARDAEDKSRPKWSTFTLPGGENYRELLLRLPARANDPNNFRSSHFDQPNILAHVRFNERVDAGGKRTLFIEELQSDWHQGGRERGYQGEIPDFVQIVPLAEAKRIVETQFPNRRPWGGYWGDVSEGWAVIDMRDGSPYLGVWGKNLPTEADAIAGAKGGAVVPNAPFKNNSWAALALKRMIRWAAENGFDQIAWTRGQHQLDRGFGVLADQVSSVAYNPETRRFMASRRNDAAFTEENVDAARLHDLVGKEIAAQLLAVPRDGAGFHTLATEQIKVGAGQRAFYDRIMVNIANDLGKKFGARVGETEVVTESIPITDGMATRVTGHREKTETVHALPITPEMRESVLGRGFELFHDKDDAPSDKAPNLEEFLAALISDLKGERRVYSANDAGARASAQNVDDARAWFEANGIDLTKSKEEIRAQIVEALSREGEIDAVTPDDAAPWFGFSSGDELMRALAALKPRAEAIEAEMDAAIDEELGDPAERLQQEARQAAHAETQARKIEIELAALEIASNGRRGPVNQRAKRYAQDRVAQMSLKDIFAYDKFLAGERRAARASREALEKGDRTEALLQKQKQLASFWLYHFARKAADDLQRVQARWRRYSSSPGTRAAIGPRHIEQIDAILDTLETGKPQFTQEQPLEEWAQGLAAEGNDDLLAFDPAVVRERLKRRLAEMSYDEVLGLNDVLRNIEAIGRGMVRLRRAKDAERIADIQAGLKERMAAEWADHLAEKKSGVAPNTADKIGLEIQHGHALMLKLDFLFRLLDGLKDGGPWMQISAMAREAQSDMAARSQAATRDFLDIVRAHYSDRQFREMLSRRIYIDAIEDNRTKAQLIAYALNLGTSYNREALLRGEGWSQEQLMAVLASLDKNDWLFVQALWDYVGQWKEESFALDERTRGARPPEVQAEPLQLPDGTILPGGYWPVAFDPARSDAAAQRESRDTVIGEYGGGFRQAATNRGRLMARSGTGGQALSSDFMGVLARHVHHSLQDITHRELVITLRRVKADKQLRAMVAAVAGPEAVRSLDAYVHRLAARTPANVFGDYGRIAAYLRRTGTSHAMGFKVSVAALNLLGHLQAIPRNGVIAQMKQAGLSVVVGFPDLLLRHLKAFATGEKEVAARVAFVYERSAMMRNRAQTFDRDIGEIHGDIVGRRPGSLLPKKFEDVLQVLNVYTDRVVSIPTWLAAYESALDGKVDGVTGERAAIDYADSVVEMTISAGGVKDLSALMASNNQWQRLLTMFMGWASIFYNQMTVEQIPGVMSGKIPFHKFAANMVWIWLLPAVITTIFYGQHERDDDEDDAEYWKRMALMGVIYPLQTIPLVRDVLSAWVIGYKPQTPITAAIDRGRQLIDAVERGDERQMVKQSYMLAGQLFGLPAQLYVTGDYLADLAAGQEDPSADPADALAEAFLRDTR